MLELRAVLRPLTRLDDLECQGAASLRALFRRWIVLHGTFIHQPVLVGSEIAEHQSGIFPFAKAM